MTMGGRAGVFPYPFSLHPPILSTPFPLLPHTPLSQNTHWQTTTTT